jgi:hypothetical protein
VYRAVLTEAGFVLEHKHPVWGAAPLNARIDMPPPASLLNGIGSCQHTLGTLERKAQTVQQTTDIAWVIADGELLLNHTHYHRSRPYAREESISNRSTVENVGQEVLIQHVQCRGSPRMGSFQQTLPAVPLIAGQPDGDPRARSVEQGCNLATGVTIGVEQDGMEAPRLAIRSVALGCLFVAEQFLSCLWVQVKKTRLHGRPTLTAYLPAFNMSRKLGETV